MIFPHCLLHDLSLFCGGNKSVIYPQRNTVSVRKVSKYSSFFCARRILSHSPAGLVEVSADIVVSVETYHARNSAVKEILCADNFKLFVRQIFFFRKLILMQFLQIKFRFSLNIRDSLARYARSEVKCKHTLYVRLTHSTSRKAVF